MATVTLRLKTPKGYPLDLAVAPEDNGKDVQALLERATVLADWFVGQGWGFADAQPALGEQKALGVAGQTSFGGFVCSPILDADGFPTWVMDGENRAILHKKNGDNWYSYGVSFDEAGKTKKWSKACLTIKSGQTKPPVIGLPGQAGA